MITQARLKELLHYDPDTGVFTWNISRRGVVKSGSVAGTRYLSCGKPYTRITIDGKKLRAHRLAWLYMHGELPRLGIDHKDGNGRNNAISNIRDVDQLENCKNRRLQANSKSGYNGVVWDRFKNRWLVRIKINRRIVYIGRYSVLLDAVAARIRSNKDYLFHLNHGQSRPL